MNQSKVVNGCLEDLSGNVVCKAVQAVIDFAPADPTGSRGASWNGTLCILSGENPRPGQAVLISDDGKQANVLLRNSRPGQFLISGSGPPPI